MGEFPRRLCRSAAVVIVVAVAGTLGLGANTVWAAAKLDANGQLLVMTPGAPVPGAEDACATNFTFPTVGGPGYPFLWGLEVDPATGHLWGVMSGGDSHPEDSGYLYELDPDNGTVLQVVVMDPKPDWTSGLGYDCLRQLFVVTDPSLDVIYVAQRNGTILKTLPSPGAGPVGAAYDTRRDGYWITDWVDNALYLISPDNGAVLAVHSLGGTGASRIAGTGYQECEDVVVVNSRDNATQYVIAAATGAVVSSCGLPGGNAEGVACRPFDETVYFSHYENPLIYNRATGFGPCTDACEQTWFEDDDPAIAYTGAWNVYSSPAATGGHIKYSSQTNAEVSFTFTGTGLKWHTAKGPQMGKAYAYLDGAGPMVVDLYRSSNRLATLPKLGLPRTAHTVVIKVSGLKNPASHGYKIYIDAFEIVP
jgi:hypothetical protein